ncbi:MAG: putative mannose-phosphate guanyltransferase [Acidobacteriaceae bacterium]|jgi:hypothetical protein|nr:putative mannose-phosphate guanyltransferase [Acidobacteriaceae bacterium]
MRSLLAEELFEGYKVKIGAILTISGVDESGDGYVPESVIGENAAAGPAPYGLWELLGKSLAERTLERLKRDGVLSCSTIAEDLSPSHLYPSRAASVSSFIAAWEQAISTHLTDGADVLLLVRVGPYVEFDLRDLLTFHTETESNLTQVYDQTGALDVAVISAASLRTGTGSFRSRLSAAVPKHRRYIFGGYANRLKHPRDFRRLTQDALLGRNGIIPVGHQVTPGMWMAPDSHLDPSAQITGPVYIGAQSRVRAYCRIAGATSIERNCDVDSGTHIEDSSILPGTFLGVGLRVNNSIVSPGKLFHIGRNVELTIPDRRIVGKTFRLKSFTDKTKSIFLATSDAEKKINQPTSHFSASIDC